MITIIRGKVSEWAREVTLVENCKTKVITLIGYEDTFSNDEMDFMRKFGEVKYSDEYRHAVIISKANDSEYPKELCDFLEKKIRSEINEN